MNNNIKLFITGRQHAVVIQFCACEEDAVTLARHQLWPSTPASPRCAFSYGYMEMVRVMIMELKASMTAIHKAFGNLDMSVHGPHDVCYIGGTILI